MAYFPPSLVVGDVYFLANNMFDDGITGATNTTPGSHYFVIYNIIDNICFSKELTSQSNATPLKQKCKSVGSVKLFGPQSYFNNIFEDWCFSCEDVKTISKTDTLSSGWTELPLSTYPDIATARVEKHCCTSIAKPKLNNVLGPKFIVKKAPPKSGLVYTFKKP